MALNVQAPGAPDPAKITTVDLIWKDVVAYPDNVLYPVVAANVAAQLPVEQGGGPARVTAILDWLEAERPPQWRTVCLMELAAHGFLPAAA
jgi:hypothetical protein